MKITKKQLQQLVESHVKKHLEKLEHVDESVNDFFASNKGSDMYWMDMTDHLINTLSEDKLRLVLKKIAATGADQHRKIYDAIDSIFLGKENELNAYLERAYGRSKKAFPRKPKMESKFANLKEDYAPGMYDSVDDIVKKYVAQVRNNFSQDQNILSIMETSIVDAYNLGLDDGKKSRDEDSANVFMPDHDEGMLNDRGF
jgi:hypothetical protein